MLIFEQSKTGRVNTAQQPAVEYTATDIPDDFCVQINLCFQKFLKCKQCVIIQSYQLKTFRLIRIFIH